MTESKTGQQRKYVHISQWIKEHGAQTLNDTMKRLQRIPTSMATRFARPNTDLYKNLVLEGMLGLMIAITKYDNNKDASISTYATYWVRARILRFIDNNAKDSKIKSLDRTVGSENNMMLSDIISGNSVDIFDQLDRRELYLKVQDEISNLPARQRNIIMNRYIAEKRKTFSELANEMQVSKQYIKNLELKAIETLKKAVAKLYTNYYGNRISEGEGR